MSLSVADSEFCDRSVDIGLPSLKYSNALHAKFGISTSEIIIDSCVFQSLCTSVHLQSIYLKPSRPAFLYFVLYIVFKQLVGFAYLWKRGTCWWMTEQVCFHLKVRTYFYYCLQCVYIYLWYYKYIVLLYKHIWSMTMSKRLVLVVHCLLYAMLSHVHQTQHYLCCWSIPILYYIQIISKIWYLLFSRLKMPLSIMYFIIRISLTQQKAISTCSPNKYT